MEGAVDEIVRAAAQLARLRYGALIVIERDTGLQDYVTRGVQLDAELTRQLLINIFFPNSPLHDAAVIVRGRRILAASVVLPLTDNISASSQLGTRHRAAIGITEESDALAVVVSEETGQMAVAHTGRLIRNLDQDRLRRVLRTLLRLDRPEGAGPTPSGRFTLPFRFHGNGVEQAPSSTRRRDSESVRTP
jgi:diadenylate cyclase